MEKDKNKKQKNIFIFKGCPMTGKTLLANLIEKDNSEIYDDVILTFENGKKYALDVIKSEKQNHIFIIGNADSYIYQSLHVFKALDVLTDRLKCYEEDYNISIVDFKRV